MLNIDETEKFMEKPLSQYYKRITNVFSEIDLFLRFKMPPVKNKWVLDHTPDMREFASKIFAECFYEILLDIIENNVTFVLPLGFGEYAEISVTQITDEDFIKSYKIGTFKDVDFVKSQFTGNRLVFTYRAKNGNAKRRFLSITGELKKLLVKYTNEGKIYF